MTSPENLKKEAEELMQQIKDDEIVLEMMKTANPNDSEIKKMEEKVAAAKKALGERAHSTSVFNSDDSSKKASKESLDETLRNEAKNLHVNDQPAPKAADPFEAQKKLAGRKNLARGLAMGLGALVIAAGIGYTAKLVNDGKQETKKWMTDYKTLQVEYSAKTKRDYALYKKIFPQLKDLTDSKLESAVKGIEESIDKSSKMNIEAEALWKNRKYDQAMKMYDQASKMNPLDTSGKVYLLKEAELTKHDQEHFKYLYVVQEGDTLDHIAKRANVSTRRIKNANGPKYAVIYQGSITKGMQLALPKDIELVSD